jgi:hypothetical protein
VNPFSERQKAELRDAIARSRIEYDEERKARRKQMRLVPAPRVDPFEMVGEVAEIATSIGIATADFEDAELGRALLSLQWQATRVGNILARRRRRKESTAGARPDGQSGASTREGGA